MISRTTGSITMEDIRFAVCDRFMSRATRTSIVQTHVAIDQPEGVPILFGRLTNATTR